MGDMIDYTSLQFPGASYPANSKPTPQKAPTKVVPEVQFDFFVLSSAMTITASDVSESVNTGSTNPPVPSKSPKEKVTQFIHASMNMVQYIWKPRKDQDDFDATKQFEVKSNWNGTFKTIEDKSNGYRRIEFPKGKPPDKALRLIKDNFANPDFDAIIPVFICHSAWDEEEEPGTPRDGLLRGFTIIKSLPWFIGERVILLFRSASGPKTLAHELSHWCGFRHADFRDDPDNIGYIGGGGFSIDKEQLRKYHRWATQVSYRKTLGIK